MKLPDIQHLGMHSMLCSRWLVDLSRVWDRISVHIGSSDRWYEGCALCVISFLVISGPYTVCLSSKGSNQTLRMCWTHHFCLRNLVCTVMSLNAEVGQKLFIRQCNPIRLRTQKQYDKEQHCLTVSLKFCWTFRKHKFKIQSQKRSLQNL